MCEYSFKLSLLICLTVGGIQINTPLGMSDYFLMKCFQFRDCNGVIVKESVFSLETERPKDQKLKDSKHDSTGEDDLGIETLARVRSVSDLNSWLRCVGGVRCGCACSPF